MKVLILVAFMYATSTSPLTADTIRLVNAPMGAVSSYFSQLTGNTYILDFNPPDNVSLLRDVTGSENIHALFVQLVEGMGGYIEQTFDQTFIIKEKLTEVKPAEYEPNPISLKRVYLEGKITKLGVSELIKSTPAFANLNLISGSSIVDAVLISGDIKSIKQLEQLIDELDELDESKITSTVIVSSNAPEPVFDSAKSPATNDELIVANAISLEVVDLNFADAEELVETLAPLLSSEVNTETVIASAHRSANQVILAGPAKSLELAISIIASMDRAPRQVYVDAIIAEISEDSAQKLGLQFSINEGSFSSSVVSGLTGNNIGSLAGNSFLTGAAGGLIAIGSGASKIPDIGIMINALKGDTDNRILATPSLMTTENKESTILIGQNVPFITGQYTGQQGDGAAPFQTIKREDLGTILKLKPKIGKNGDIIMEIWQEISRIDQSAAVLSDVVTVKRQISTVVSAKEGETIAIGGLRVEQEEIGVSKVPFLGDIPVLGVLFKQESSKTVSRNLAIFLRPTLVSTRAQRDKIVEAWKIDLGEKLFSYDEKKVGSRDPVPVGNRLNVPPLRPKMRESNGN